MAEERDTAGFLYRIGDTLTHRASLVEPACRKPQRLFVVERRYQECPGGVQRHYCCRLVSSDYSNAIKPDFMLFNEEELCPLPPAMPESPLDVIADIKKQARTLREAIPDTKG